MKDANTAFIHFKAPATSSEFLVTYDGLSHSTEPPVGCVCVRARANGRVYLKRLLVGHQQLIRHSNPIIFLNAYNFSLKVFFSFLRKKEISRFPVQVLGSQFRFQATTELRSLRLAKLSLSRFERGANVHFMTERGPLCTRMWERGEPWGRSDREGSRVAGTPP